jgi:hypothetical protein
MCFGATRLDSSFGTPTQKRQWLRIRPRTEEQLRLGLEYREREPVEEVEGS